MITLRRTEPTDIVTLAGWIAQDPSHKNIEASFFTATGPGVSCYVIEDEEGPAIFVRQEAEGESTRLHTQFPGDRKRVANALRDAYPIVACDAKERGFKQIRFESSSIALVRFMFGFGFRAELIAEL